MRADGADVFHLPGPRLVAVRAAGERAYRANIDARAALVALQMVPHVGGDFAHDPAIDHAERAHTHALVTDAHAAVAENASRRIEEDHGGELLLWRMHLLFRVAAFACAVAEDHVLQFALAALIAYRTIQRMVGQEQLQHALARLPYLRGLRTHHHALGNRDRT